MLRVGFATPAHKTGLKSVLEEASNFGLSAVVVRFASGKSWTSRSLPVADIEIFRSTCENLGLEAVTVVGNPLISLGAEGEAGRLSVHALAEDLLKAGQIGARYLQISAHHGDPLRFERGIAAARKLTHGGKVQLLLENGAPAQGILGSSPALLLELAHATGSALALHPALLAAADFEQMAGHAKLVHLYDVLPGIENIAPVELEWGTKGAELAATVQRHADKIFILGPPRGMQSDVHNLAVFRRWSSQA